jgi:hypothetical protein
MHFKLGQGLVVFQAPRLLDEIASSTPRNSRPKRMINLSSDVDHGLARQAKPPNRLQA